MIKRLFSFIILPLLLLTACNDTQTTMSNLKPHRIIDYVIDLGVITNFNENAAINVMKEKFFPNKSGCSAIVTQVNGKNLVGRNCDISVSESPIIKFILDINQYKTMGLMYPVFEDNTKYEYLLNNGLDEYLQSVVPYAGSDYLNEKGLYIEMNMRNPEVGYEVNSTNPASNIDLYVVCFPAYAATRCANVNEAVELAKTINFYNNIDDENVPSWNYGFTLADAEGNYGVLEIAKNKVIFTPKYNGQANFYIADELKQDAKYQCGESRFQILNENLEQVKTQSDMLKHMEKTYYSYVQTTTDPDKTPFDIRSEWTEYFPVNEQEEIDEVNGETQNCTTEWLLNDSRKDEIYELIKESNQQCYGEYLNADGTWNLAKLRQNFGLMDDFWMSMYSCAVDCNEKTMKIRFFEDNTKELEFSI